MQTKHDVTRSCATAVLEGPAAKGYRKGNPERSGVARVRATKYTKSIEKRNMVHKVPPALVPLGTPSWIHWQATPTREFKPSSETWRDAAWLKTRHETRSKRGFLVGWVM